MEQDRRGAADPVPGEGAADVAKAAAVEWDKVVVAVWAAAEAAWVAQAPAPEERAFAQTAASLCRISRVFRVPR